MIVTKDFIKENDGNCLDHICIYVGQLEFISQVVYDGAESLNDPVFLGYDHSMVIGMSEVIRDTAQQIEMICDAANTRDGRQCYEIKFLKKQINRLAGEEVADGLLAAFRTEKIREGDAFFSDLDREVTHG